MKKNLLSSLVLVALALLLLSCGGNNTQEFTQTQNEITATFSIAPASPTVMEPVTLLLSLTVAKGQAIVGAQVAYNLTMPGMTMPPNQLQAMDEGNGLYTADATFTMSGDWRAEVTVDYGGELTIFNFDFSVK